MKDLKDLTPEIRNKILEYKKQCTENLYNGVEYNQWKKEYTVDYINYIYKLGNQHKKPVVIIANSPKEYKIYYNLLFVNSKVSLTEKVKILSEYINDSSKTKEEISILYEKLETELKNTHISQLEKSKSHYLFLCSEYSRLYLMWYKFIKDEFQIKTKQAEVLDELYSMVYKANIAKVFLCKEIVLVLRMPKIIKRNEIGFHSIDNDGAIIYDNEKHFYINNRKIPNWVFEKFFNKSLTFDDFVKEQNEDIKAGIITLIKENGGNVELLKFLNAVEIDSKQLVHENGHIEIVKLYKTKEKYSFLQDSIGNINVEYAWTEMTCPSTNQVYLIDTCPSFKNVIDSVKFHRPKYIPNEMDYNWSEFSN